MSRSPGAIRRRRPVVPASVAAFAGRTPGAIRRRRRAGLVVVAAFAAVAALVGLAGCGLPSQTEPKYAGPAQSPAAAQGGQKSPPKPTDGSTTEQLVASFLSASVGANLGGDGAQADANKETLDRMRQYMTTGKANTWKPAKAGVVIVRDPQIKSVGIGNGRETVTLQLEPLGILNENGEVTRMVPGSPPVEAFYQTVLVGGQRRFEDVPRDQLYISESGLREWYTQQPIYFWTAPPDVRLVPDLRYMPSTLSPAKQVTETLRWLQNGPGQLVNSVVVRWADSIEIKDNPVLEDSEVKVNLTGKATSRGKDELARLARQIRWSLPDHKPVKLTIETQEAGVDSEGYLNDNAAVEAAQVDQTRYIIANESARSQVIDATSPEDPLFRPGPDNTGVISAAINRQGDRAALVRRVGTGAKAEQRLFVSADPPVADPPHYIATNVAGAKLSRPAWLTYPARRLMVSDGSHLWVSRAADGKEFDQVELSTLSSAPITAFAVAPEGRRIAFIADRVLMVAPLLLLDNGKITIGTPVQPVTTSLGDNQAVGWLTETTLAVGGKPTARSAHPIAPNNDGPRYNLVAVTIDGAQEEPLPQGISRPEATSEVTELVCRVNRPGFPMDYPILYEANGVAQRMFASSSDPMWPLTGPSPATPVPGNNPTAPFFAD